MYKYWQLFSWLFLGFTLTSCGPADTGQIANDEPPGLEGKWDVEFQTGDGSYPSWWEFEIEEQGQWKGRFVGRDGSARLIDELAVTGPRFTFRLKPQYEKRQGPMVFAGVLEGERLIGSLLPDGEDPEEAFTARRAPDLTRDSRPPQWSDPVDLIGSDLSGWQLRYPDGQNGWSVTDGVLTNQPPSVDLRTVEEFEDFELELEFRIPEGGNSGIYLRGRYEVQVSDTVGRPQTNRSCGSVYGFLLATPEPECTPDQWHSYRITLVGRMVTVALDGQVILDNQEIPGVTGGALDSREDLPGPIMIQGDHGGVELRNLRIRRPVRFGVR